ncbi:non-canonical purine NTP pyrophosphatase, RdgB/HAM1 family [Bacteriovorax stolpii]|uniref:dITP/XTP pyrophosphatase n=1 Tax=Bacteriovorax stolpii TaxID=960 RepID=A0A2K9NWE7_BACTC|nr:RdgB/HAM1 family non-canonical purine NTP pyrophosphatase [Bacteriovorax stolpii]AUN99842.1 non-canonical purine NTP pyrophosphatase, RdgB/HAM1 family [Bacteriovorax stolpii]TDP54266.1 XTP/dITP diphosphohydrolase [Bacteriovorax stolpii]
MELLLASGNDHKAEEFSELFDPKILVVKAAPEKIDVAEDGSTYFENALLKAKAYYDKFKVPVIADDSGLNVQSLPNELGLHSARFGGPGLTDRDRAELLLKKMDGVSEREAYFSCVLCVYFSEKEIFYFEGRLNGSIGYSYRGSTGFGYDPVFIPTDKAEEGLTVAELHEWKQKNSHRAVASALLSKFLAQRN